MELSNDFKARLNEVYRELVTKAQSLMREFSPLVNPDLLMSMSYLIKHYIRHMYKHKEESLECAAQHSENHYPIPVIRLSGLCDVEIDADVISVFTRLKRVDMLKFDFSQLDGYSYDAYGYGAGSRIDFCDGGDDPRSVRENILSGSTEVIDFYFDFPFDADEKEIFTLISRLQKAGFFF